MFIPQLRWQARTKLYSPGTGTLFLNVPGSLFYPHSFFSLCRVFVSADSSMYSSLTKWVSMRVNCQTECTDRSVGCLTRQWLVKTDRLKRKGEKPPFRLYTGNDGGTSGRQLQKAGEYRAGEVPGQRSPTDEALKLAEEKLTNTRDFAAKRLSSH